MGAQRDDLIEMKIPDLEESVKEMVSKAFETAMEAMRHSLKEQLVEGQGRVTKKMGLEWEAGVLQKVESETTGGVFVSSQGVMSSHLNTTTKFPAQQVFDVIPDRNSIFSDGFLSDEIKFINVVAKPVFASLDTENSGGEELVVSKPFVTNPNGKNSDDVGDKGDKGTALEADFAESKDVGLGNSGIKEVQWCVLSTDVLQNGVNDSEFFGELGDGGKIEESLVCDNSNDNMVSTMPARLMFDDSSGRDERPSKANWNEIVSIKRAKQLLEKNKKGQVIATCRDPSGATALLQLKDRFSEWLDIQRLDLTDERTIEESDVSLVLGLESAIRVMTGSMLRNKTMSPKKDHTYYFDIKLGVLIQLLGGKITRSKDDNMWGGLEFRGTVPASRSVTSDVDANLNLLAIGVVYDDTKGTEPYRSEFKRMSVPPIFAELHNYLVQLSIQAAGAVVAATFWKCVDNAKVDSEAEILDNTWCAFESLIKLNVLVLEGDSDYISNNMWMKLKCFESWRLKFLKSETEACAVINHIGGLYKYYMCDLRDGDLLGLSDTMSLFKSLAELNILYDSGKDAEKRQSEFQEQCEYLKIAYQKSQASGESQRCNTLHKLNEESKKKIKDMHERCTFLETSLRETQLHYVGQEVIRIQIQFDPVYCDNLDVLFKIGKGEEDRMMEFRKDLITLFRSAGRVAHDATQMYIRNSLISSVAAPLIEMQKR